MEFVCGPLFIRTPIGYQDLEQATISHKHHFDHVTFVTNGKFRVEFLEPDGDDFKVIETKEVASDMHCPWVLVKKDHYHRLISLQPNSRYMCVFAHRSPDNENETVEYYTGWSKAYG